MAGFYSSSSSQGDVLSTPYVQDPKFITYTDANTMTYLNPASELPHRTSISSVIDGGQNFHGLSLTLNTNMSSTTSSSKNSTYEFSNLHGNNQTCIEFAAPNNFEYNTYQYEQTGVTSAVLKSKYLQATQKLLHEVVSVREAVKRHESEKDLKVNECETSFVATTDANERRDLQNKLDKLLAMLDEVDKRYKQYYHQMQILVSSFDLGAGCGAAKPYTTLALKTISRHFRCLRDVVSGQIEATRKSLGEQDPSQGGVIPRLRYVDQQLRQQRALQQFGMLRHAWRPQRGLPENAVTVLRAWLFEHFLHPYPKDSEKSMLARQTGLTRGQVANWFINARVRLWKPMVEEMYKEEFSNAELNSNSSTENAIKETGHKSWASEDDSERHDDSDTNAKTSLMSYQLQGLGSYKVDSRVSLALGLQRIEGDVENRMGTGLRSGVLTDNGVGAGSVAEYSYLDSDNRPMFGNNNLTNDYVA